MPVANDAPVASAEPGAVAAPGTPPRADDSAAGRDDPNAPDADHGSRVASPGPRDSAAASRPEGPGTPVRPAEPELHRPTTPDPDTPGDAPTESTGTGDVPAGAAEPAQPVRRGPRSKAGARAAAAAGGAAAGGAGIAATVLTPRTGAPVSAASPSGPASSVSSGPGSSDAAETSPDRSPTMTISEDEAPTTALPADRRVEGEPTPQSPAAAVAATVKRVVGNPSSKRTRKARLRLAKFDPWSVMKTTFLFSIAFMIASLAAVMLLYSVISSSGVFDAINDIVGQVLSAPGDTTPFLIEDWLTARRVAGFTVVVGVLNVVLMTAIGTLAAFLYNLAASLLGGLEVTLAED